MRHIWRDIGVYVSVCVCVVYEHVTSRDIVSCARLAYRVYASGAWCRGVILGPKIGDNINNYIIAKKCKEN